uniref:Uncharacterized protein n=1 Tax=Panagrolaimus sp. JU765 TaxID=591449 RepID=A0AC34QLB7_9BILA
MVTRWKNSAKAWDFEPWMDSCCRNTVPVGQQRYSAISFDDITHITNCISETKLHEEQREQRKKFFKNAKYSTEEYQEQALVLRERIVRAANEVMLETKLEDISWQSIQDKYLALHGQVLNKKHLREGFPTGHPSAVIEKYMKDEFVKFIPDGLTGNIFVKFTRPFDEIIKFYEEARQKRDSLDQKLKMPEFRTADNGYVDYVRERQKKELYLEKCRNERGALNVSDTKTG